MKNIEIEEFKEMIQENRDNLEIIDVREQDEWDELHFKNSKLIPMFSVANNLDKIDWNKIVIFICRTGARSGHVASALAGKYEILNLVGGISACYRDEKLKEFLNSSL